MSSEDEDASFNYESLLWFMTMGLVNKRIKQFRTLEISDPSLSPPTPRYEPSLPAKTVAAATLGGLYKPFSWRRDDDDEYEVPGEEGLDLEESRPVQENTLNMSVLSSAMSSQTSTTAGMRSPSLVGGDEDEEEQYSSDSDSDVPFTPKIDGPSNSIFSSASTAYRQQDIEDYWNGASTSMGVPATPGADYLWSRVDIDMDYMARKIPLFSNQEAMNTVPLPGRDGRTVSDDDDSDETDDTDIEEAVEAVARLMEDEEDSDATPPLPGFSDQERRSNGNTDTSLTTDSEIFRRSGEDLVKPLSPLVSQPPVPFYKPPFREKKTRKRKPATATAVSSGVVYEDDDDVVIVSSETPSPQRVSIPTKRPSMQRIEDPPTKRPSIQAEGQAATRAPATADDSLDDLGSPLEISDSQYRREIRREERNKELTEKIGPKMFTMRRKRGGSDKGPLPPPPPPPPVVPSSVPPVPSVKPSRPKSDTSALASAPQSGPGVFAFPDTMLGTYDPTRLEQTLIGNMLNLQVTTYNNIFTAMGADRQNMTSAEAQTAARKLANKEGLCVSCPPGTPSHSYYVHVAQKVDVNELSFDFTLKKWVRDRLKGRDVWLIDQRYVTVVKKQPIVWPTRTAESFFLLAPNTVYADNQFVCPRCEPIIPSQEVRVVRNEYTVKEVFDKITASKQATNQPRLVLQRQDFVRHLRAVHTDDLVGDLCADLLPFPVQSNFSFEFPPVEAVLYAAAYATGVFFNRNKPYPILKDSSSSLSTALLQQATDYIATVSTNGHRTAFDTLGEEITSQERFQHNRVVKFLPTFNLTATYPYVNSKSGSNGGSMAPSSSRGGAASGGGVATPQLTLTPAKFRLCQIQVPDRGRLLRYTVLMTTVGPSQPLYVDGLATARYMALDNNTVVALKGRYRQISTLKEAETLVLEMSLRKMLSGATLFSPLFQISFFKEQIFREGTILTTVRPVYLYQMSLSPQRTKLTDFLASMDSKGRAPWEPEGRTLTVNERFLVRLRVILTNRPFILNTVNTVFYLRKIPVWDMSFVYVDSNYRLHVEIPEPMLVQNFEASAAVRTFSELTALLLGIGRDKTLSSSAKDALDENPAVSELVMYLNGLREGTIEPQEWSVSKIQLSDKNPVLLVKNNERPVLNMCVSNMARDRPMPRALFDTLVLSV